MLAEQSNTEPTALSGSTRRWWQPPFDGRSVATVLIIAITVFGFGLRLWKLDWEPLHVDELRQATEVQAPLGDILRLANVSVGAPLDHLIGKALVSIAPATDFTQRLPSAAFGAATVGLIGLILLRQRRLVAAVLASLFVAVNPLSVELSQYVRPYALPVLLVIATIAVYQHWHLGNRGWNTVVLFAVVATLALLSRPLMPMLALGVLGFIALFKSSSEVPLLNPIRILRSDPLALIVLPVVFVLVWIPNAYFAGRAASALVVDCWRCDEWARLADSVENFGEFGELAMRPLSLVLLLAALLMLFLLSSVRRALAETAFIWLPVLATAPLLTLVYGMALRPGLFFAIRYLVFLPVGFALFFAIGVDAIVASVREKSDLVRGPVIGAVLLIVASTSVSMFSWTRWQSDTQDLADWRSTASHIRSVERAADVIVTIDTRPFEREFRFGFMAAPRYYRGMLLQITPNDTIKDPSIAASAGRYHFVLFVPKMADGWEVPLSWTAAEFSEMLILTSPPLETTEEHARAWWQLTQLLRPDVAVRTQIAGASLERALGTELYPWVSVVTEQARLMDQSEYAAELMDLAID